MPKFVIAMIYGEAAPDPAPAAVRLTIASSMGSLDAITIPTQSADPTNIRAIRAYIVLNARLRVLRGSFASPATIAMYSGPTIAKLADHRAARNP